MMSFLIVESISEYILYSSNTSFQDRKDFYGKSSVEYGCVERDAEIETKSNNNENKKSVYNTAPLIAVVGASSRSLLNSIAPRLGTKNGEQWMQEEEYLTCTNQSQSHLLSKTYCGVSSSIASSSSSSSSNNQRKQFSNFTTEEETKILAEVEAKTSQNNSNTGNNNNESQNIDASSSASSSSAGFISGFRRLDPFSRDFYEPYVVPCDEKLFSIFVNFADSFTYATKLALCGSSPIQPHEYQVNGATQKCHMLKQKKQEHTSRTENNNNNNSNLHDEYASAWKPLDESPSSSSSSKKFCSTQKFLSSLNSVERKTLAKCSGNLHSLTFRPPQFAKLIANPPAEVSAWFTPSSVSPETSALMTTTPHFEVDEFFPIIQGNESRALHPLRLLESVTLDGYGLVHRPYLFCHCCDEKEKETNNNDNNNNKESEGKDVFDFFSNNTTVSENNNNDTNNNPSEWEGDDLWGKTKNYVIHFDLFYLIKRLAFVTQNFSPESKVVTFFPSSSSLHHQENVQSPDKVVPTCLLDENKIFPQPLPSLRKLDLHDIQVCRPTNSGLPHDSQGIPASMIFSSGQNLSRLKYLRHLRMSHCDLENCGGYENEFPSTVFLSESIESEIYWNQLTPEAQQVRKQKRNQIKNNNNDEKSKASQDSSSVMQHVDAYNSQKFCFKIAAAAFPPLRRINFWKSRRENFNPRGNDDDDGNDNLIVINSLANEGKFLDAVIDHDSSLLHGTRLSFWARSPRSMLNHNHLPPNLFSLDLSKNTIAFIDFEDFPQSLKNSLVLMNFSECSLESASAANETRSGNKKTDLTSQLLSFSRENYYFDFHVFSDFSSLRELNLSKNTSLQFPKNSDLGALPDSLQLLDVGKTLFDGPRRKQQNESEGNVDDEDQGPDFTSLPRSLRILQMSSVKASGRIDLRNLPPNLEVLEIGLNDLQFTLEIESLADDDDGDENNNKNETQRKPIIKLPDTMHFISLFRNKFKGNLQKLFFCNQEWTNSRSNLRLMSMSSNLFSGSIFPLPFLVEKINLADNEKLSTPSELEGLDCARFPRHADYINLYNCPSLRGPLTNLHLLPPECQVFGIRCSTLLTLPSKTLNSEDDEKEETVLDLTVLPRKMLQLSLAGCSNLKGKLILKNGGSSSLPAALSRLLIDGCNFSGEIDFSNSFPRGMAQVRLHNNKNLSGKLSMEHFRNRKMSHLTEFSIYGCDFEGEIDLEELFSENCCPKLRDQFKWKDDNDEKDNETGEKKNRSKLIVIDTNKKLK